MNEMSMMTAATGSLDTVSFLTGPAVGKRDDSGVRVDLEPRQHSPALSPVLSQARCSAGWTTASSVQDGSPRPSPGHQQYLSGECRVH